MRRFRLILLSLAVAAVTFDVGGHTRITTDLNFSKDVRAVLRQHCMGCHNPRGMAPSYVDLTTYGTDSAPGARAWATAIEEEILTGRMPPWQADPRFDHYSNSRRMTQEEIDIIIGWVQGGAPQGPRRGIEAPQGFGGEGWVLGSPDVVIEGEEPFMLPADQQTARTSFSVAPELTADSWVTGFEFQPGSVDAVYRMAAWIHDPAGAAPEFLEVEVQTPYDPFRDEDEREPTRLRPMRLGPHFLGQWVRGDAPVLFPQEMGRRLRMGSRLEVVVEYRRRPGDGAAEITDQSRLGLFLAQTVDEVELIIESDRVGFDSLALQGKKARKPVSSSFVISEDVRLIGLAPELSTRLSSVEVQARFPDSRTQTLLLLEDYDPEFPASFYFSEPIHVPGGTTIEMIAAFAADRGPIDGEPLVVDLLYAIDEHLVLPEPEITSGGPARPASSSGGMLVGDVFSDERMEGSSSVVVGTTVDPRGAAHMDHSPLHGGQFFMAANQYHHVEGALPSPGVFRIYVYDDFKKPIDPRNFAGRVVFEEWNEDKQVWVESSYPMAYGVPGTDYLEAQIPESLLTDFYAALWLAGEESRYDFYFEAVSTEPDAVTLAKYAALTDHSHERPPLAIPETAAEIVAGIVARTQVLRELIESDQLLALHVPALECRDLAEALLERLDGLAARDAGQVRQAAGRIMQTAYDLDRAGDLGDSGRATLVFDRFRQSLSTLDEIIKP